MDKENLVSIHSGDVLTKEQTEAIYELAKDFGKFGYTHDESIEFAKATIRPVTLDPNIDWGRIVEKFNSIPEVYPIKAEDLKKILERFENESN